MPVLITRRAPGSVSLSVRAVRTMALAMLAALELESSELSILLTNDEGIRLINREHRDKDRPTDVLSFPQNEFRRPLVPRRGHDLAILGDVILSLDTAQRQARGRRRPLADEVRFLLAHGLLHLLGYDHATPEEKKVMSARTRQLVPRLFAAFLTKRIRNTELTTRFSWKYLSGSICFFRNLPGGDRASS